MTAALTRAGRGAARRGAPGGRAGPGRPPGAGDPTRRLFVALEPDEAVRAAAIEAAAALRRGLGHAAGDFRWAAPGTVHLTLRFLGEVAEPAVATVSAAVADAAAASRPLALLLSGAGAFPSARRPRVLWLGLSGDLEPLAALASRLDAALAPLGLPPEGRPFTPHLTVARARSPRGARPCQAALDAAGPAVAWSAREVTLFESHLEPGGVRHVALLAAPLGARGPRIEACAGPGGGEDTR